jgi:hypothetical protein
MSYTKPHVQETHGISSRINSRKTIPKHKKKIKIKKKCKRKPVWGKYLTYKGARKRITSTFQKPYKEESGMKYLKC